MIILALDSGLERTGFAVFKKEGKDYCYLNSGLIRTNKNCSLGERLDDLYHQFRLVIDHYKPEVIVIERLFFHRNKKTLIEVAQAQGVILLAAARKQIGVKFLTPLQIKNTLTGYGKADKKSVQKMLKIHLNLAQELKQDDIADAIACGLAYYFYHSQLV